MFGHQGKLLQSSGEQQITLRSLELVQTCSKAVAGCSLFTIDGQTMG